MSKRGRKPIQKETSNQQNSLAQIELSKNQQIVRESNGLAMLFGNRVVFKYREEYLAMLKQKYGNENFMKYLETDPAEESLKYTQDYLDKNERRNQAVMKYREKEKQQEAEKAERFKKMEQENRQLEMEIINLERQFVSLTEYLYQNNISPDKFSPELIKIINEYNSL